MGDKPRRNTLTMDTRLKVCVWMLSIDKNLTNDAIQEKCKKDLGITLSWKQVRDLAKAANYNITRKVHTGRIGQTKVGHRNNALRTVAFACFTGFARLEETLGERLLPPRERIRLAYYAGKIKSHVAEELLIRLDEGTLDPEQIGF